MGLSENSGVPCFGGPYKKEPTIYGTILGSPIFGNPHIMSHNTYSLHCSSFLGLPFRILTIELVKPKKRNYNGDSR